MSAAAAMALGAPPIHKEGKSRAGRKGKGGGGGHKRRGEPTMYQEEPPQFMFNPFDRPTSEQLTDLHVYIVPGEYWDDEHHCAFNTVMNFTTSAGFIRVYPETRITDLRALIYEQIVEQQGGFLPNNFVFLKSVGRALTLVKQQQEAQLKAKNFVPPFAYAPELFIMEKEVLSKEPNRKHKRDPNYIAPPQHSYVPVHHSQQAMGGGGSHPPAAAPPHSTFRGGMPPMSHQSVRDPYYARYATPVHAPQPGYPSSRAAPMSRHGYQPQPSDNFGRQPTNYNAAMRQSYPATTRTQPGDPRVYPPRSENFPGFGGYHPTQRVGYPMDYGPPPMSATPPQSPQYGVGGGAPVNGVEHGAPSNYEAGFGAEGEKFLDQENTMSSDNSESTASAKVVEITPEERQRQLEREEMKMQRENEAKERELELKMREAERLAEQQARELEFKLADEQKKMEESKYKLEREMQEAKDKQERQIQEMERNLQRQQQEEQFKQQKELDNLLREQEKMFSEKQKELEKMLREQEMELRSKFAEEEKSLMQKERELEKAKMELEKMQMMKEKELMQKKTALEREKRAAAKERQALEKEEREQLEAERLDNVSRVSRMQEEGNSRPGTAPSKMKFPRAKTPDLLEEFNKRLGELHAIREERAELERSREDLIRKAHSIQTKAQQKRTNARESWKKKYFEEKKKTGPLEEHAAKLRREVDNLNRKVVNRLEKEADTEKDMNKSNTANNKAALMRLQQELDDVNQKSEEMKSKLMCEMKKRVQAEKEIRNISREVKNSRVTKAMGPPKPESPSENDSHEGSKS